MSFKVYFSSDLQQLHNPTPLKTPSILRLLIAILFSLSLLFTGCKALEPNFNQELSLQKEKATKQLKTHIARFNAYKNRPAPDGPFNATNNEAFLVENVPLFTTVDSAVTEVYNYRWWMISKHLKQYHDPKDEKDYWVFTEFFGVPNWASLSGAITCPLGQQFYDVRWLRNAEYLQSYADYFLKGSASYLPQRENGNFLTYLSRPESHHFSSWLVNGVEAYLKIHPNKTWTNDMLPYMEQHQQVWDSLFTVKNSNSITNGLYKIMDLYDGMEFSLSAVEGLIASKGPFSLYTKENWREYYLGWGTTDKAEASEQAKTYPKAFSQGYPWFYLVRPSVNSYAYANLQSIADLYVLTGNTTKTVQYQQKANAIKEKTLEVLWNTNDAFFNTYTAGDNVYGIKDFEAPVRESVGYTPWYFNMIPKSTYATYGKSWELFSSPKGFYNTKGMTTAEQQHPYYNEQAYAWNGRGWPFQNSVVYKGYANYLRNYKTSKKASEEDKALLLDHIEKLTALHGDKEKNIGEWYIPSNGEHFGGVQDYFHSTYPDIIINDLIGFIPSHDNSFTVSPLLPEHSWNHFYLGNINYHGHTVDIIWNKDWDTNKEGDQSWFCIWVDKELKVKQRSLEEVTVLLDN